MAHMVAMRSEHAGIDELVSDGNARPIKEHNHNTISKGQQQELNFLQDKGKPPLVAETAGAQYCKRYSTEAPHPNNTKLYKI